MQHKPDECKKWRDACKLEHDKYKMLAARKDERIAELEKDLSRWQRIANDQGVIRKNCEEETDEAVEKCSAFRIALSSLAGAEREYRRVFQTAESPGHLDVGRSWDKMRKAGDAARKLLGESDD